MARPARYTNVVISGLAHVDAPHRVTSTGIEEQLADTIRRLGLGLGALENIAGIVERRFWDVGVMPSDVAAEAGERLLETAGVPRGDIGALINTSVDRDYLEPSTASIVHAKLGLSADTLNFDVGSACLGFLEGMALVAGMIERGEIDHGLVVDGEGSRRVTESTIRRLQDPDVDRKTFRHSFATLTLGSGAAAMLLSRADLAHDGHAFRGIVHVAATQHHRLCLGEADDMRTDTRGLLRHGVGMAAEVYRAASEHFGFTVDEVDALVIHQVSKVHTTGVIDAVGIDPKRVPLLFPFFGNIGPAGLVITLSKEAEAGAVATGDRVLLLGVGSGLNGAVAEVIW